MGPEPLRLGAVLFGHACLLIAGVNTLHGLGLRGRWADYVTLPLAALGAAVTLMVAAPTLAPGWRGLDVLLSLYEAYCLGVALVGFPLATALRWRRRAPEGTQVRSRTIDLTRRIGRESCIGRGLNARLLRLPANESLRLEVSDWLLALPGLPAELDGLSVVHLTDLHMAPCYPRAYFEAAIARAARWDADLVVLTGDIVEHDDAIAWVGPILGRLRGRLGSFAILGNHDYYYDVPGLLQALSRAGFEMIDGLWTSLDAGGATLAIGGTSAPWGPRLDTSAAPVADFRLVLSHSPDQFPRLAARGIDLVLAGHNHGGQVRLPVVGPVFMPSVYGRRFDAGVFARGGSRMVVGRGLGAANPFRLNCPPEIARIVLTTAGPTARTRAARRQRAGLQIANPRSQSP